MHIDYILIEAQHDLKILYIENLGISILHSISPGLFISFRISINIGVPIVNLTYSIYNLQHFLLRAFIQ